MNAFVSVRNMEMPMLLPRFTISISRTNHALFKSMRVQQQHQGNNR
jgi:hypothetical protein